MSNDTVESQIWLAAHYHIPSTYSLRVPFSSPASALAMPAPGPATVRLAMIRTGIEILGLAKTKEILFPLVCSANICIQPPRQIGMANQMLRAEKVRVGGSNESITYREFAHCEGDLTIFIQVPTAYKTTCADVLRAIGYWGQGSSFAFCSNISEQEPFTGECGMLLEKLRDDLPIQKLFTCLVTEFKDKEVNWGSIFPDFDPDKQSFLKMILYVWPLCIERRSNQIVLHRCSLDRR